MRLGIISGNDARYLMGAPAMLGGFVIVGGEWINRVTWADKFSSRYEESYLAALTDNFTTQLRGVRKAQVISAIDADMVTTAGRNWARESKSKDLELLAEWRKRIEILPVE